MLKKCFISALIAGLLYSLIIFIGNRFILNTELPLIYLLIEFIIFTIVMTSVYYFINKRKNNK